MTQMTFHNTSTSVTPPQRNLTDLPILTKLSESYKLWHDFLTSLPRLTRYTLGIKIDNLFTECLELTILAGYSAHFEKLSVVQKLSTKIDALKFFLKLLWEIKLLDSKKYANISELLVGVGKMAGGWLVSLKK